MSNPNHDRPIAEVITMKADGKDPFAGVSTPYLLRMWRAYVDRYVPDWANIFDHDKDKKRADLEEQYYALLKAELNTRPHVSNKRERKLLRQQKAKQKR